MKSPSHTILVDHYQNCFRKHGDNHLGVDWPNAQDAELRYRVALEIVKDKTIKPSILDVGCGTAGMLDYARQLGIPLNYVGLDLGELFVEKCREKFPKINFYHIDLLQDSDQIPNFDYLLLNGVFTEKRELSFEEMWEYCKQMITVCFAKAKIGMAFNVMSKFVDWERDDLFHLSHDLLADFLTREVSRNYVIRNDYGLYEYYVYLYK